MLDDLSPEGAAPAAGPQHLETAAAENRILRRKLQSKAQALLILSKELERLRRESDDYRELTERLQAAARVGDPLMAGGLGGGGFRDKSVAKHFSDLREENRRLLAERERLRRLLDDREEDVRALRGEIRVGRAERRRERGEAARAAARGEEVGEMVGRLEGLQGKLAKMKQDLQSLLDEKEDLVQERDAYKCKSHRLNHALAALLKSDGGHAAVDVDWLVAENRFLAEGVRQLTEEKQLANDMGKRYKAALEKSKRSAAASHGGSARGAAGAAVEEGEESRMVEKLTSLISRTSFPLPAADMDLRSAASLRELALALLETLNDRMTQLKHQRQANKHIVQRLTQLESKIEGLPHGDLILRPSQHLMRGYSNADVDSEPNPAAAGQDDPAPERDGSSPDMADLLKKFQALAGGEGEAAVPDGLQPPDIIAEGIRRPPEDPPAEEEPGAAAAADPAAACGVGDDPIVLPEHLQRMVDKAMEELVAQPSH